MVKFIYPAIFKKEDSGYTVLFPDLPGCFTEGETVETAFAAAQEALALYLDDVDNIPVATKLEDVKADDGDLVLLVEADDSSDIVYFKKNDVPKLIDDGLREKGYTKNQAAQILGVDRSYMTHLTKGDRVPSPEMAKRIGSLLGFDWRIFYA